MYTGAAVVTGITYLCLSNTKLSISFTNGLMFIFLSGFMTLTALT